MTETVAGVLYLIVLSGLAWFFIPPQWEEYKRRKQEGEWS